MWVESAEGNKEKTKNIRFQILILQGGTSHPPVTFYSFFFPSVSLKTDFLTVLYSNPEMPAPELLSYSYTKDGTLILIKCMRS